MATWTQTNKSSDPSWSNPNKNSASWATQTITGSGWQYDQTGITYDGLVDPTNNAQLRYDESGGDTSWSLTNRN